MGHGGPSLALQEHARTTINVGTAAAHAVTIDQHHLCQRYQRESLVMEDRPAPNTTKAAGVQSRMLLWALNCGCAGTCDTSWTIATHSS